MSVGRKKVTADQVLDLYEQAKKEKRLQKYGYFAKKGKFGYVLRKSRRTKTAKNKTVKK